MILFAFHRILTALAVAWLALTLSFVALRWIPGDALDSTLTRAGVPPEEIATRRAELGFDDPIWQQYATYLAGVMRGDFGESLISGLPVRDLIAQNLGATASLAAAALMIAVVLGVSLGIAAGLIPRWGRYPAEATASLMLSTPVYWTATLAIYLFTVQLDWLPGVGGHGPRYLILPACVLGFHTAGSIAQVTRASLRDAATQDFVRTARAKGLADVDVLDHILRVGLLPVIAVVALQLGFLLGGTVITETIFVRRGLGTILIAAINNRDYPVIQGVIALAALLYSVINALADIVYAWVDPRVVNGE